MHLETDTIFEFIRFKEFYEIKPKYLENNEQHLGCQTLQGLVARNVIFPSQQAHVHLRLCWPLQVSVLFG